MMSATPLDKRTLRKRLLEARRAWSPEERCTINNGIFQHTAALDAYRQAKTVFLYCSTREEISTEQLFDNAFQTGKRVCVPLCTGTQGVMTAHEILSLSELSPGHFGIPEPSANAPRVAPEMIDLCIIPCLAADRYGYRLGYGGGYYDRFLAQTAAKTVVFCAHSCFFHALPAELHDRPCGIVVTERQVHIAAKK